MSEILLVVIGILIALSINNWNENRKLDIVENEFLEGVKNDLMQDKEFIKLVIISEIKYEIGKLREGKLTLSGIGLFEN